MERKRIYFIFIGLGLLAVVVLGLKLHREKEELARLEEYHRRIVRLKAEYLRIYPKVYRIEKRIRGGRKGLVKVIEDLVSGLGIKKEFTSLKIIRKCELRGLNLEEGEIYLSSLNMNTLVNLLYTIEHGNYPLTIKRANIKTTFEDAELLEVRLTLCLFSRGG